MPPAQRAGNDKTASTLPFSLEGHPPRPPSPRTKSISSQHQQSQQGQQQQRPRTPSSRPLTTTEVAHMPMPSYSERAAASRGALNMTNTSANTNNGAGSAPTSAAIDNNNNVNNNNNRTRPKTPNWPATEYERSSSRNGGESRAWEEVNGQPRSVRPGPMLKKQRSNYFEQTYQNHPLSAPLHGSFRNNMIIVAALTTNVFISDDWTICHDIAQLVARRYERDANDIMVSVQHGICYFFQGDFSPAYMLTLSLQPGDVSPALNRRNAAILQTQLHETLGVHPQRGVVRFLTMPDDCLAWNGATVTAMAMPPIPAMPPHDYYYYHNQPSAPPPAPSSSQRHASHNVPAPSGDNWDAGQARRRLSVKSLSALRSRGQTPTMGRPTSPGLPPMPMNMAMQAPDLALHPINAAHLGGPHPELVQGDHGGGGGGGGGGIGTADTSLDDYHSRPSSSSGKLSEPRPMPPLPAKQLKTKKSFVANLFMRRSASRAEKENSPGPDRY